MMNETAKIAFPIDLVYLWVDGADPVWRAKRNQYMPNDDSRATESVIDARWIESDELLYSLRSVERHAPWINHIYIITDGQCPKWLDVNHPKISLIDHRQILPEDALPTFNSHAIESCIYRIPGLSEHFIVGNDDTLFVADVEPTTFFKEDGSPIVRLVRFNRRKAQRKGNYTRVQYHMQDLVNEKTGELIALAPHHNFDAYRKSDFEYCVEMMKEAWHNTSHHRFRSDDDMQRSFVALYAVASKRAELRKVGRYNRIRGVVGRVGAFVSNQYASDSRCMPITSADYQKVMRKYNPLMLCMNDGEGATNEDRRRMVSFLKGLFAEKSSFEV